LLQDLAVRCFDGDQIGGEGCVLAGQRLVRKSCLLLMNVSVIVDIFKDPGFPFNRPDSPIDMQMCLQGRKSVPLLGTSVRRKGEGQQVIHFTRFDEIGGEEHAKTLFNRQM
jgi:hypothetical protein